MTELEVPARYQSNRGKLTLTLSGNGYSWDFTYTNTRTRDHIQILGYCENINNITVIFNDNGASYFKEHFIAPYESTKLMFDKDDAKEIYDMLTEHLKWSPEALAAGTAHKNLEAARNNFSRAGGGGGAGGGNESSGNESSGNERKSRKTRKSRKSKSRK